MSKLSNSAVVAIAATFTCLGFLAGISLEASRAHSWIDAENSRRIEFRHKVAMAEVDAIIAGAEESQRLHHEMTTRLVEAIAKEFSAAILDAHKRCKTDPNCERRI